MLCLAPLPLSAVTAGTAPSVGICIGLLLRSNRTQTVIATSRLADTDSHRLWAADPKLLVYTSGPGG